MNSKQAYIVVFIACVGAVLFFLPSLVEAFTPSHSCYSCHASHKAKGNTNLKDHTVNGLCLSCHGPVGKASKKIYEQRHYYNTRSLSGKRGDPRTCVTCHLPHKSDQLTKEAQSPLNGRYEVHLPPRFFNLPPYAFDRK